MEEEKNIKTCKISNAKGRMINEALWEIETQIESERGLISNFTVKCEERNLDNIRKDLKKRRIVSNNNPEVEQLDKFIRLHEKEIEKIRKFEI
jgi:hypothetical protein